MAAPTNASTVAHKRLLSRECDAPPNPVCAPPEGTAPKVAATVDGPVEPPAPGDDPVSPVDPEPTPALGATADPSGEVVVVVVVDGVTKLFSIVAMQVTALPPPVAVPLHWLMVTGSAETEPVTVQSTADIETMVPPPVAEPLHCVTAALVVLPVGLHTSVSPPPVADPMHWSTVTSEVDVPTGTSFVTVTSQ
jgi:hypothetical protein